MQTVFGYGGNCQSATIATLLGLGIEDVPSFWTGTNSELTEAQNSVIFNNNVDLFLENFGYKSITLGANGPHMEWVKEISSALSGVKLLVNGKSPRGYMHSVIYQDGELWHDPHPEGGGVIAESITFIVPIFGATQ